MSSSSSSSSSFSFPETLTLIPGLPNDISASILASLPLPYHFRLKPVSRSWRHFFSSPAPIGLRHRLGLSTHLLCLFPTDPSLCGPFLFDPLSSTWSLSLPPLPVPPSHLFSLSNFSSLFLHPHLYLLGGSLLDARSFPLYHPLPSPSSFRINLATPKPSFSWERIPNMLSARGSFACAADEGSNTIVVAGGGSRHRMYPMDGSRIGNVEVWDTGRGEWREGEGMGRCRAGCVGFVRKGEFWVLGGYGEYRAVRGVVPGDVYCRDAVVMGLESGRWREVGEMWEEGERSSLGKVGVVEDGDGDVWVFMLDRNDIFRYDFSMKLWLKETSLRKKVPSDENCCFVAMNGELYVLSSDPRRSPRKRPILDIQVYNPKKRKWKFLTTTPPFSDPFDLKAVVYCTVKL